MKIRVTLQKPHENKLKPINYQVGDGSEETLAKVVGAAVQDWITAGFRLIQIEVFSGNSGNNKESEGSR